MVTLSDAQVLALGMDINNLSVGEAFNIASGDTYTLVSKIPANTNVFTVTTNVIRNNVFLVSKNGSDQNTPVGTPFLTIGAALTAASTYGQPCLVQIEPGTYNESGLTIPVNVALAGTSRNNSIISFTATTSTNLINVLNANTIISNLTLKLITTTNALTLKVVNITANNDSLLMNNCDVLIDASTVTSGDHYNLFNSGTATAQDDIHIRNCDFDHDGNGTGTKRCVFSSGGNLNFGECTFECFRITAGAGSYIAVETATGTPSVRMLNCFLNGFSQDISQTTGTISINRGTVLFNKTTNSLPLTVYSATDWQFGDPGTLSASGWLYRGTEQAAGVAVLYYIARPTLVYGLVVNCRSNAANTATFTVQRTPFGGSIGATALTCSLASSALTASDTTHVASFGTGDYLSIIFTRGGGGNINDTVVQILVY
jgi:hypothetical protein